MLISFQIPCMLFFLTCIPIKPLGKIINLEIPVLLLYQSSTLYSFPPLSLPLSLLHLSLSSSLSLSPSLSHGSGTRFLWPSTIQYRVMD